MGSDSGQAFFRTDPIQVSLNNPVKPNYQLISVENSNIAHAQKAAYDLCNICVFTLV